MSLTISLDNYTVNRSFAFDVTVACPLQVLTSNLVTPISSTLEYDLALRKKVEVALP